MSKQKHGVTIPARRTTGDTVEDRLTDNAYNRILPARYLKKDENGDVVETPEELFSRVAQNVAVADAVYTDERVTITPDQIKPDHPHREDLIDEVFDDPETSLTEENAKYVAYDPLLDRLSEIGAEQTLEQVQDAADEFREHMEELSFMPNSPTLMNAGDELQQLSACFVDSPDDDISDIKKTEREAAEVFQSGGGMGYAFWRLRPYGDQVGSTGGIASGPLTFMQTFDENCGTIAQGGARRGAQMGVMRVSHPDVIQFIHAKNKDISLARTLRLNDPDDFTHTSFAEALEEARELIDEDGRVPEHLRNAVEGNLSNFNISVGITDEFMDAVQNDEEYTFTNPRTGEAHIATEETAELYEMFGLGEHVEVGEPLSVPARELWDDMIEGAHQNGEPGLVFLDRINDEHSFSAESTPDSELGEYEIAATNPCGEQPLMEYEPCNLGHVNLSTIAQDERTLWGEFEASGDLKNEVNLFLDQAIDWEKFDRRIQVGTHFLDNVVTMSDFPVDKIEEAARQNRKIGLGIMGLAQLFVQLGVRYGEQTANEIARQLMRHINHESKAVSRELAHERGVFENWDDSKYADPLAYREWFEHHTGLDAEEWAAGFEIRNHNTTTIAPTGTTSMVGNTTGGCEPIYNVAYYKNVSDDVQGDEMLVEFDDYFLEILEENGIDPDTAKREAEELMAANEFDGIGDLDVVPDDIADLFVTTEDLSAREHASIQCALQEGVDSAISKTVNAPNDQSLEGAKETFEYVYENGGKGVTYYRQGTRSKQVLTTNAEEWDDQDEAIETIEEHSDDEEFTEQVMEILDIEEDPWYENGHFAQKRDRPGILTGVTQRVETGYGKLYVTINEDSSGRPFELFAEIGNSGGFTASFTEALAKTVSTALRSGVDPEEIASELEGIRSPKVAWDDAEQIQSIPDAIGTAMRRYLQDKVDAEVTVDSGDLIKQGESPECPDCGSMDVYFSEGCQTCAECGWSKC